MEEEDLEPGALGSPDNSDVPADNPNAETESQAAWGNLSADDLKFVENKGWKSPLEALKSYHELEKSAGNKIALPKADDAEAVGKLLRQLGAPEDAAGYKIENIRDVDQPFMEGFRETAKNLNILPSQAAGIYNWYREAQGQMAEKFNQQSAKDQEELKTEWGDAFSKNQELMNRGWRLTELPQETLENIEFSMGTKAFMQLGKKLGDFISEDNARGIGARVPKSEEISPVEFYEGIMNGQPEK